MAGSSADTGQMLDGFPHVVQSIRDIIFTPIGTRVMRRDYGSEIPAMLDRPLNEATIVDATMAIAEALDRWEPRFRLELVDLDQAGADGQLVIALKGIYRPNGEQLSFQVAA